MRAFCHVSALAVALFAAALAQAADPPKKAVRPIVPPPPVVPTPMPGPESAITLEAGVELLISHDTACIVEAFPASRVTVRTITVPAGREHTLSGKFIDPKTGQPTEEDQTYTGPCHVYRVKALEDGPCEIFLAWGLAKDERQRVRIDCKVGPRPPPPVPPKPPEPKPPEPKPPEPVSSFRVIFVYESADTLSPQEKAVIYGKVVSDYLDAHCTKEGTLPGWRRFDKDATGDGQPVMRALWQAVKPKVTSVPCVAVEVSGKVEIVALPATPAEAVALFKKYLGEK